MSKKALLSRRATVAHGALMVFLKPQLAMDAKIDLTRGLSSITAANFAKKRPVLAAWIMESVKGKLAPEFAQDSSIKQGLDEVLDMIQGMPKAEDEFPDKKDGEDPAEDADMDDEDADLAGDEDETDEEKAAREKAAAAAKDKKAKDKKAKDEAAAKTKEEDGKAMDAAIKKGIDDGLKAERERMQAISEAKEVVRPRVGALQMAFDSAGDVYRKAIVMVTGKEPPKGADADMLKFAYENLPTAHSENRSTLAMDSAAGGNDLAATAPEFNKMLDRIGSA